jgi:hypothetical protein
MKLNATVTFPAEWAWVKLNTTNKQQNTTKTKLNYGPALE